MLIAHGVISLFLPNFQVFFQPFAAQFAGGAVAASVGDDAVVAGERLRAHEVEYAQFVRELPYLALVAIHQGRVDDELFIHREIQRDVERTDKGVSTVRIAAVISFGDARHQVKDALAARQNGGKSQKDHVAPRNESVRIAVLRLLLIHGDARVGERAVRV